MSQICGFSVAVTMEFYYVLRICYWVILKACGLGKVLANILHIPNIGEAWLLYHESVFYGKYSKCNLVANLPNGFGNFVCNNWWHAVSRHKVQIKAMGDRPYLNTKRVCVAWRVWLVVWGEISQKMWILLDKFLKLNFPFHKPLPVNSCYTYIFL